MTAVMLLLAIAVSAQSNVLDTTRVFYSVKNTDLYSGQTLMDTFNIELNSHVFKLSHDNVEREFVIENVSGSWASFDEEGQLIFDILVLDLHGKGKIERVGENLYLTVDLSERKDWMKRKFTINPMQP